MKKKEKVVLAFSGGLDTSIILKWLQNEKNLEVVTFTADIGQVWIETLLAAESIGQFRPVSENDTFDLEYWSLEQAKLGSKKNPMNSGKVVIITGAGGTIGSEISKVFSLIEISPLFLLNVILIFLLVLTNHIHF